MMMTPRFQTVEPPTAPQSNAPQPASWMAGSYFLGRYLTPASVAPSTLVAAPLFTQRSVSCGRHLKRLSCAAALKTSPRRPSGFSATCPATRVAQCERLLEETCPSGARTWELPLLGARSDQGARVHCPTHLVSQRSSAPGPLPACAQPIERCTQSLGAAARRAPDDGALRAWWVGVVQTAKSQKRASVSRESRVLWRWRSKRPASRDAILASDAALWMQPVALGWQAPAQCGWRLLPPYSSC